MCLDTAKERYGDGRYIRPKIPGRRETPHMDHIYLPQLLPLEEYDKIIVLFSGGKDSLACILDLLERGVPREKIELWHHNIDGGHPTRSMDWPVTQSYIRAVADYLGLTLRTSWRVNGFWGEVYRLGASWPVCYEEPATGDVLECGHSARQAQSARLCRPDLTALELAELKKLGYRMKFPAKSGNLAVRWCSSVLKIMVADSVIRSLDWTALTEREHAGTAGRHQDVRLLLVSGERRQESAGRSRYNEMELHRTSALARAHRLVHQWRSVIDWDEAQVWEMIKRWRIAPHPCYAAGWSRCSCAMCIFSLPRHWAGIRELFPDWVRTVEEDEQALGFTWDNQKPLAEYIGTAESCVCHDDPRALEQLISGRFSPDDVKKEHWTLPAGAFCGSEGGPC